MPEDQQLQFVEVSVGGWSAVVPSKLAADVQWYGIISNSPLHPSHQDQARRCGGGVFNESELRSSTLAATGTINAASTLGYSCGKDVQMVVDMKDRKGSPAGTVVLTINADHYREELHADKVADNKQNSADILNTEVNLVESEVDHVIPVPMLPSVDDVKRAGAQDTEMVAGGDDNAGKIALTARSDLSKLTDTTMEKKMLGDPREGREQISLQDGISKRLTDGRHDGEKGEIDPAFDHLNREAGGNRPDPIGISRGSARQDQLDRQAASMPLSMLVGTLVISMRTLWQHTPRPRLSRSRYKQV